MAKRLDFKRRDPTRTEQTLRINLSKLAAEIAEEQAVHDRLSRAVRRAIEAELAAIDAERDPEP